MGSQTTFIQLAWEIRDELSIKVSPATVMRCTYPDFVQMVMDEYYEEGGTRSENIVQFMEYAIKKNGNDNKLENLEKEDVRNLLLEGRHQRTYRIVLASDVMEDGDRRIRDIMQCFLSTKSGFALRNLICPFFCDRGASKKRSHIKPSFNSNVATRFQQILYIYFMQFVGQKSRKMRGGKKINPGMKLIPDFDPSGAGKDRLGWGLQMVVEAWDEFAKFLNFLDVEEMVHSYLLFKSDLTYEVLSDTEQGFIPLATKKGITFPVVPTKNKDLFSSYLLELSQETNDHLRSLTNMFIEDLENTLLSNDLYSVSTSDDLSYMSSFKLQDDKLPSRFEKLSMEIVKKTAKEVLEVKGKPLEEGVDTFTTQVRNKRRASVPSRAPARKRRKLPSIGSSTVKLEEDFAPLPLPLPLPDNDESHSFSGMQDDVVEGVNEEPNVSEMMKSLESEMAPYARLHCCKFQEIVEVHEAIALEELEGMVQLVLTDPPYNIRRVRGDENSDYDHMTVQDMMEFVDLVGLVLRPGGHGIIFCSYQQHRRWVKLFSEKMVDNEDEEKSSMFAVDPTPLITVRHSNHFTGNPVRSSCGLMNSAEYAVHVKKNGLRFSDELKMVNYRGFNHIKSTMQGFRNVIDNVKRLVPGEQVRMWDDELNKSMPLRCEQKSIALMQELICRFSQPNDIVLDTFAGTFSTAVASVQLSQPRRFIGCEADVECFNISRKHVVRRFSEVVTGNKQKFQLSAAGIENAEFIASQKSFANVGDENWQAPGLFPPFQRLPSHLLSYLANDWNEMALFLKMGRLPLRKWDESYQAKFEQVDVDHMLNVDASVQGLCITTSVNDGKMERKVFATKTFQPSDVVCKVYGSIVYEDLSTLSKSRKTYENGIIGVSQEEFKLYGRRLFVGGPQFQSLPMEHLIHGKKYVYIVPAKFCVSRYIQKVQNSDMEDEDIERKGNVVFRDAMHRISDVNDLVLPDLIQLKANKVISIGDEVCIQDDTALITL